MGAGPLQQNFNITSGPILGGQVNIFEEVVKLNYFNLPIQIG